MGQLTNQFVSQSYQSLLKMTDSNNGVTGTLQTVQTGDGVDSPLQISRTQVNISGSLTVNGSAITGTTGSNGTSGTSGVNGSSGTSGQSGSSGSTGSGGTSGTSGTSGGTGSSGTSGSNGSSGTSGVGTSGTSGTSGQAGSSGTSGTSGTSGQAGSSGTSGTSGGTGSSGTSGDTGSAGTSGTSGTSPSGGDRNGLITTGSISTTQSITGSLNVSGTFVIIKSQLEIDGSLMVIGNNVNSISSSNYNIIHGHIKNDFKSNLNTFLGNTEITGSLNEVGDLYVISPNQTTDFSNISSSNKGNIIFGARDNISQVTQTGSYVISGSNNIIQGKVVPTVGYYSFISGSYNILNLPINLSTGSVLRPATINNIIGGGSVLLNYTTSSFGPPQFSNNLKVGTSAINVNHQSGSGNINSNLFVGSNIFTSTQNNITSPNSVTIQGNIFHGTQTFNHISSSIALDRNIFNGLTSPQIDNHYSSSVNNNIAVNRNLIFGQQHVIYVSGSNTAESRTFNHNFIGGSSNVVSSSYILSTGSNSLTNTMLYGNSLMVSASNSSGGGSVFIGRFNATGSLQESSQDAVFVVGTGGGSSSRRNAIHVDTLNNTRITGSVLITGSLSISNDEIAVKSQIVNNQTYEIRNTANSLVGTQSGSVIQMSYNSGSNTSQFAMLASVSGQTGDFSIFNTAGITSIRSLSDSVLFAKTEGFPNTPSTTFEVDATKIILSGNTSITGSVNITGSLSVNGVDISGGGSGTSGLITTGSFGVSQSVSGSLLLSTGPNAGQPTPFVIQPFSNSSSAAVITGSVLISGSLLLNGDTITSINRNGLITTGSNADGEQYITGGLYISSSGNFDKPSLTIKSGPNEGKIGVEGGNFLYRNSSTYNTVVGNVSGINVSTPFTSGSEKNLLFTGFNLGFTSGSNNSIIAGAGGSFLSGSNNTILGSIGNLQYGNGNLIIGGGRTSTLMENVISIGNSNSPDLLYKSGSVVQMGYSTQVTGSLDVSSNTILSSSLKVLGDVQFSSGSNKTIGTVALDGANPGVATVSNSLVTSNSIIFLTKQTLNHTNGYVAISSKGTGTFTITSNHNGDTDVVAYQIINPA